MIDKRTNAQALAKAQAGNPAEGLRVERLRFELVRGRHTAAGFDTDSEDPNAWVLFTTKDGERQPVCSGPLESEPVMVGMMTLVRDAAKAEARMVREAQAKSGAPAPSRLHVPGPGAFPRGR